MSYSERRSRIFGCLGLLAIGVLSLAALKLLLFPGPYSSAFPRTFDSQAWKDAAWMDDTRCAMLADLEYRIGLEGRSRADVTHMLGEPHQYGNDPAMAYWQLCPSFLDMYVLRVRFEDDQVAQVWVHDT